jgi:hypothetical protein
MKKITLLSILLFSFSIFSQQKIEPVKEITYGNFNHTNRDFLNGSLKDSNDNIYLLGSTENDFTFNDAKIIKLDKDLNVLWEKEKSFNLGISYDGVIGAHLDSNDNLIIIFRAAYTSYNQTFIVSKYDSDGNFLWEYPLSDLSSPIDYEYYTFKSFLDTSNNISLVYNPVEQSELEFFFTKLSSSGQLLNEFSTSEPFWSESNGGYPKRFKIIKNNGVYNTISLEDLNTDPYQKFTLYKFTESTLESFDLDLNNEAINFFSTPFDESWTIMKKDNNDNLVLLAPSPIIYKDYGILNVNPNGTVKYIIYPDDSKDKYPLEFGFDNNNNLLIVSNNRTSSTSDNLEVTLQKYNQNGDLIFQTSVSHTGLFATITESKISILTDQNKIVSFDYDFNNIDEVQLNNMDTYNFEINNLLVTDSNYFLSGYTEDVNYSGSVLISEIDMLIKKADNSNELNSYRFSGKGTSKIFTRKEVVVRDTAYAFAITEKLGPDNFSPSGSVAPQQQRFLTLEKSDLTILEDQIVPLDEILYTTYYPKDLTTPYTENGDLYEYVISADTTNISLHKNNDLEWSRDLDLYIEPPNDDPFISDDEMIFDWKVNKKGDFFLSTYIYGLQEFTLHKFSLNNEYNTLEFDELIVALEPMSNHWLFTMNEFGEVTVYSDRLTIINQALSPFSSVGESSFYIKEKNNQILFHKHNNQNVQKFNQFGEIQSIYFEIDTPDYGSNPHKEYDNNYLILLEQIGMDIYLNPEYSWNRAVIKKYDLDVSNTFDEISYDDDDADGITNDIDECRNTPVGETANSYGCSLSQTLSANGYQINIDLIITYPNPSKGIINFNTATSTLHDLKLIEVFDNIGRKVLSIDDSKDIMIGKLDLINQKEGIYFIKFYFGKNQVINKKIIKVH